MGFDMKEYLVKDIATGDYFLTKNHSKFVGAIEIPEGAFSLKENFIFFNQDSSKFYSSTGEWKNTPMTNRLNILWQRESPNDKLASAEQYRQAEVLPFIDDEPKNVDLASGCDLDELAKEYGFRDRDIGESCLSYRESLKIFTALHKSREWDLSDYDFAESDAWIESNIEQDNVNNPSHYADSAIECIDAMQAMLTPEQFVGYLRGNIFKYQWRYEKKNGVEDLKKSQWYLDKLISAL